MLELPSCPVVFEGRAEKGERDSAGSQGKMCSFSGAESYETELHRVYCKMCRFSGAESYETELHRGYFYPSLSLVMLR